METAWESELAAFLTQLSAVQEETLRVLTRRRDLLAGADLEGLAAIAEQEKELIGKLQGCLERRQEMLKQAGEEGLPSKSLRALAGSLPAGRAKQELSDRVYQGSRRARLLQHHGLTNWVLAQRTLLHLSQILEIIATGGRMQPTYGKGDHLAAKGALVDRAI